MAAGRAGEAPSTGLTERLVELGFETDRLKTGTPARVDKRTVDFSGGCCFFIIKSCVEDTKCGSGSHAVSIGHSSIAGHDGNEARLPTSQEGAPHCSIVC